MHKFKELNIWKGSMSMAKKVCLLTRNFPKDEKFGLVTQINRAAVSIPSNIAEWAGRNLKKEFSQFLKVALGSSYEPEPQLLPSADFEYLDRKMINELTMELNKIQKMISARKNTLVNSR